MTALASISMTSRSGNGTGYIKRPSKGDPGTEFASSVRSFLDAEARKRKLGSGGELLAESWAEVMLDPDIDIRLRLRASDILADRAYGKPSKYPPVDWDDQQELEEAALEAAAADVRAEVLRLASRQGASEDSSRNSG